MSFLGDRLIRSNSTVTVYRQGAGRDAAGGTTESWAIVASAVPGLASGVRAERVEVAGQSRPVLAGTFTCDANDLFVQAGAVRLVWQASTVPGLTGLVGESVTITPHGSSPGNLQDARCTIAWREVVE